MDLCPFEKIFAFDFFFEFLLGNEGVIQSLFLPFSDYPSGMRN